MDMDMDMDMDMATQMLKRLESDWSGASAIGHMGWWY